MDYDPQIQAHILECIFKVKMQKATSLSETWAFWL